MTASGGIKRSDTLKMAMANEPDDLSQLLSLEEDSVRDALHSRFDKRKIYTHINNLLVAVNPYQMLPLYGDDMLKAYTEYGPSALVDGLPPSLLLVVSCQH